MYIGCARNSQEVARALALAAQTFRPDENQETAIGNTRLLMSSTGIISKQNVVVLIDEIGEIHGTCFLIDRLFFRSGSKIKGTFLTQICIAKKSRGKGLSALLMKCAIENCERRGSVFAILIARRAVDHFYNKFKFWGLSQYSQIHICLQDVSASSNLTHCPATEEDLVSLNGFYEATYSALRGSCERSIEHWRHILWKARTQKNMLVVFRRRNVNCGYAIFSGSEVHELASARNFPLLDLLRHLGEVYSLRDVILSSSPQHRIVYELGEYDFSINRRQCAYGGHMVRVIDHNYLLNVLEQEVNHIFTDFNSKGYLSALDDLRIEFKEGKVNISLNSSPLEYGNTCHLMGASSLSLVSSIGFSPKSESFNVPLVDQV